MATACTAAARRCFFFRFSFGGTAGVFAFGFPPFFLPSLDLPLESSPLGSLATVPTSAPREQCVYVNAFTGEASARGRGETFGRATVLSSR